MVPKRMAADPFDLEGEAMKELFPTIVSDLADRATELDLGQEFIDRFMTMLKYNLPNTGMLRGEWIGIAYKMLEKPENLTPENLKLARIVGWCILMLECFFETNDDILDGSQTRRGQKCWYKVDNVGMQAINDAMIIHSSIYYLLNKYFHGKQCYLPLMELFQNVTLCGVLGIGVESCCNAPDAEQSAIEKMTLQKYRAVSEQISGKFFWLPVAAALYLAGIHDPIIHEQAKKIAAEIGFLFIVQDDYLDRHQDAAEGKIRWAALFAYGNGTSEQRKILKECYGKPDQSSLQAINEAYEAMDIGSSFRTFEAECVQKLKTLVKVICKDIPQEVFTIVIDKLYGRDHDQ